MQTGGWRRAPLLALLLGLGGAVARGGPGEADAARPVEAQGLPFTDVTASSGIGFVHSFGDAKMDNIVESAGGGVTVLDYDGDGRPDLFFPTGAHEPGVSEGPPPSAPPRHGLFRNVGDCRFEEAGSASGAGIVTNCFGAAAGDYDNDGDPDLYLCNYGRNVLLRNDGGRFVDVTEAAGVGDPHWSVAAAFSDLDGDGLLDLFVANYLEFDPAIRPPDPRMPFPSPLEYRGRPNRIYRNLGSGRFADVTEGSGVGDPKLHTMGLAVADFDGDGRPDVFASGDGMANAYYRNLGGFRFEEIGGPSGLALLEDGSAGASMGAEVLDLDGDLRLDLLVPDFGPGAAYLQVGPHRFRDRAMHCGIGQALTGRVTWSSVALDADHDGLLDLFCSTGSAFRLEGETHLLLRGLPGGRWADVSGLSGAYFREPVAGRGAAVADFDGDGDLDVAVAVLGGRPRILRNDAARGRWLQLRLRGVRSNRDALGARVDLAAGGRRQVRVVAPTSGYLSQNGTTLHFGLGAAASASLEITWPGGRKQKVEIERVDRLVEIREPPE